MNAIEEVDARDQDDTVQSQGPAQTQPRFTCLVCGRAFRRAENLKRHAASHSQERPFQCSHAGCAKAFYRLDALHRHETVHKSTRSTKGTRSSQACLHCAAARVKCSGEVPCVRCKTRSVECRYPRKKGTAPQPGPHAGLSPSMSNTEACPAPRPDAETLAFGLQNDGEAFGRSGEWGGGHEASASSDLLVPIGGDTRNIVDSRLVPDQQSGPVGQPLFRNDLDAVTGLSANAQRFPHTYGPDDYLSPNILSSFNWWSTGFSLEDADANANAPMHASPHLIPGLPTEAQPLPYALSGVANTSQPDINPLQHNPSQASQTTPSYSGSTSQSSALESISRFSASNAQRGGYYVDGDGARLPRNGKRRKARFPISEDSPFTSFPQGDGGATQVTFQFPDITYTEATKRSTLPPEAAYLTKSMYQDCLSLFRQMCISPSIFVPFGSSFFPSLDTLNWLVQLFYEHFLPVWPLLHLPTLDISRSSLLLPLSMAAIGSHYVDVEGCHFMVLAMHEFVRRAICRTDEICETSYTSGTDSTYAKLLNCIGLFYSGFKGFNTFAWRCYGDLISAFHRMSPGRSSPSDMVERDWAVWRGTEANIRLIAAIWLVDSMVAYHFQAPPRISWSIDILLPCDDPLWEVSDPTSWQELCTGSVCHLSLQKVLQILYMEKRLRAQTGEFAKTCLIHGLYRELWRVEQTLRRPLSRWSPTAERIDVSSMTSDVWLPRVPEYEKWRNASCDVIDVLHWRAMSIIANSGTESPTVHHLHFSRTIILTPYDCILRLALLTAGESSSYSEESMQSDRQLIHRWATEDQFKARLAMIHAGAGFWHIRRFSTGAFYEATNIFLSTLAIWAYGSFSQAIMENRRRSRHESDPAASDSESDTPTSFCLDRPTDDELVQLYVKDGAKMTATISGVGDISGPKGPYRALKEGRKTLREMNNWGISARHIRVLSRLIDKYETSPSPSAMP